MPLALSSTNWASSHQVLIRDSVRSPTRSNTFCARTAAETECDWILRWHAIKKVWWLMRERQVEDRQGDDGCLQRSLGVADSSVANGSICSFLSDGFYQSSTAVWIWMWVRLMQLPSTFWKSVFTHRNKHEGASPPPSPLICSCVVITLILLLIRSSKPCSDATLKSSCNPQTGPLKLKMTPLSTHFGTQ